MEKVYVIWWWEYDVSSPLAVIDVDKLDDYIEHPEYAHQGFMKYIYNMVLFGITYQDSTYPKINNTIRENILKYLVNIPNEY